ncbi:MAG: translocation/assembly module TamB domain-containing protein [Bacteroidota bacterium]
MVVALQFPYVQTKLAGYVSNYIYEKTGFRAEIEQVNIDWFDEASLKGVKVYDNENNLMIEAERLGIDYDLPSLINKEHKNIDLVEVTGSKINLVHVQVNDSTVTLNLNAFINRLKSLSKSAKGGSTISVDAIHLSPSVFTFNNVFKDSVQNRLDLNHLTVDSLSGTFSDFSIVSDSVSFNISGLKGKEHSTGFEIKELNSFFRVSKQSLEFLGLELKTRHSVIGDTIILTFNEIKDLNQFMNKVNIDAHISKSLVSSKDLAFLVPRMKQFNDVYQISGEFKGKINRFRFTDFKLLVGQSTYFAGDIDMGGLPNIDETFISADLQQSQINIFDLQEYFTRKAFDRLLPFKQFRFDGRFIGFPNDFVAYGDFDTRFGRVKSDINLKIFDDDLGKSEYSGNLTMTDFDLGSYWGDTDFFQHVNLTGKIDGSGFKLDDADFVLEGEIESIGIKNYTYKNIQTDARFAKELFEGSLSIDDPYLQFTADGSVNFRDDKDVIDIQARLDTLMLDKLNLSKDKIFISSNFKVDAEGLQIDSLVGNAIMNDTHFEYKDEKIDVDSLFLTSTKEDGQRSLSLRSNLLDADLMGQFDYTRVYVDFLDLFEEYWLNFKNDQYELAAYYEQKKKKKVRDYNLEYALKLKDINSFIAVFNNKLSVSPNTQIQGSFTGGYTSIFSFNTYIDTLRYDQKVFIGNEVDLNSSKVADSTNVLAMWYITSEKQQLNKVKTKDFLLEAIWNKDHIDFEMDIDEVTFDNYAKIVGTIDFLRDVTKVKIDPSDIRIFDQPWHFNENNLIQLTNDEVEVNDLKLFSSTQSISANGFLSPDPQKTLSLSIDSLNLENFNILTSFDVAGVANGSIDIYDAYDELEAQNDLTISHLTINEFLIGDIIGSNKWNKAVQQFDIQFAIQKNDIRVLELFGNYDPYAPENSLSLDLNFDQTNLNLIQPFVQSYFSGLNAEVTGNFRIEGTPKDPYIYGSAEIDQGKIRINYLNTTYRFDGFFSILDEQIIVNDIQLYDAFNNRGYLNGVVDNQGFTDFILNLNGEVNNFQVFNLSSKDNDLFYGSGFATGDVSFLGDVKNLSIKANASTDKGTRIFIPLTEDDNIAQEDFINFRSLKDTLSFGEVIKEELETVDLRGLEVELNLDVNTDAYCEIIFDLKAGDIIRGRGNGDLKLQIDTKGTFNMFGDYEIADGGYNFTLYNIINKEFKILPKSRISWFGDPYEGVMDIDATYNQLASIAPIFDTAFQKAPEIRRSYPTEVKLYLDGPLLSPSIDFDINIKEYPRTAVVNNETVALDTEIEAFKQKLIDDEQELKRQVFSLIVLRRFSPQDAFNTGGALGSSVSEFVSNQLSYWITQVDENLEIDVDLGQLDDEAFNTFQLRLSYTFLDGRLRVTRDGGFTDQNNQADIETIAGDWTLEYLLSEDGKFRVKMYKRTNYNNNINSSLGQQNITTTGVSILHTQSFNDLRELFSRARKKERKQQEQEKKEDPKNNDKAIFTRDDESK